MMRIPKWLGIELVEVSIQEKMIASLGGGISILVLIAFACWLLPAAEMVGVVTSMGASAVLLFGLPHGQLSQPWPVLAGQGLSAALGVACAQAISHPALASACAVGLSIGAMYQLKCIHPPGGATAFVAVVGGPAIHGLGFSFVFFPVMVNAVVMVGLAILINLPFSWRRYPAILSRPRHPEQLGDSKQPSLDHEEILAAIRSVDSFVDIDEEDLVYLVNLINQKAKEHSALAKKPGST